MSGYLENLRPETQVDAVFHGIYRDVQRMTDKLRLMYSPDLLISQLVSARRHIPDFDLSIVFNHSDFKHLGLSPVQADICPEIDDEPHALVSVSSLVGSDREYASSVDGYVGTEGTAGSYRLSQRGIQGNIDVLLMPEAAGSKPELAGRDSYIPPRQIGDLAEEQHQRLDAVACGILGRLAAVRLILDGGSAQDVLMTLGRCDVEYTDPRPDFSHLGTTFV